MVVNQILAEAEERMKKQVEACRRELSGIRSGKASPGLLDTVRVEAYGQAVPLQQVGSVSAPEPRLLVVQPWDKSLVKAIMKAIQQSELGLNPTDDGTVIRIPIPTLTEERRKDMVKLISKLAEDGQRYGINGKPFQSDRYLVDSDTVTVGKLVLNVRHCPGHTPGHVVFHHPPSHLAIVGDVLFQGSIGRTDFPRGNHQQLIDSITTKLWPLGEDIAFVPGHGPISTFGRERQTNPFVADRLTGYGGATTEAADAAAQRTSKRYT